MNRLTESLLNKSVTQNKKFLDNREYSLHYKQRQVQHNWRHFVKSQNFNILATIQSPFIMNPYMFEERFKKFSELDRTTSIFYSAERNTNANQELSTGYHIHLLIKAHKLTKGALCYALDLKPKEIPYYETVDSKVKVASYVTKKMKDDQIHYNIY